MEITITNQKGGVGKTSLTFHLGYLFSRDNKKTLLIDNDPQGNLTSCFIDELPTENNIRLIFEKIQPKPIQIENNLYLIGTDITLSKYESDTKLENFFLLKTFLSQCEDFDIILIDTPPSLGLFTSSALLSSKYVLIPVDISKFSFIGLRDLIDTLTKIKETANSNLSILGILLSITEERLNLYKKAKEQLQSLWPDKFIPTPIPNSVKVKEAIEQKKPIFDIYPEHKVSVSYKELYKELLRRLYG